MSVRNEDCSPRPTQINIVSTAAMHTPLPRWVKSPHYRAAALLSGFALRNRRQNGFNATLCAISLRRSERGRLQSITR